MEFFLEGGEQGQSFLGLHSYTTADSTPTASVRSRKAVGGSLIVATATDADGNTSEFSAAATVSETLLTVAGQREIGNLAIGQNDLSHDAHDDLMYGSLTAGELSTPLAETLADRTFEEY